MDKPKTLVEAIRYFSKPDICLDFVASLRWPEGAQCPICTSKRVSFLKTRKIWKCKDCKKQFSVKVGTIFEDSPLGLDKWLCAIWMVANCKNGISSYELSRHLGITQKSGWFMLHRIRLAMQSGTFKKLSGEVEVDESFIGGKSRNMHRSKREKAITGTGGKDKTTVLGMVERCGEVKAMVVSNRRKKVLQRIISDNIESGSSIFTDELKSYDGLGRTFVHQVINHAIEYANGNVHTNTMENFWSLLKRSLHGTYVSVEPYHLFRYLDEQAYRYNNRHLNDGERFMRAVSSIAGRRLTWNEATGALAEG